ncbi:MAG TPA: hypothetical protein VF183_10650 [Acidimicrobiales bacterium]
MKQRKRRLLVVALFAVAALVAAACGDDDDTDGTTATTQPENGTTTTTGDGEGGLVEGCEEGVTDPSDMSVGRKVARCEPGFPAPQPLPQMETVRVSSAFRLEFNSPLLLADTMGELEKENLKMEFINLPFSDAVPQMADGRIDVAVGGIEIALFNAGHNDLPVRAVLANYFPPHAGDYSVPQTGLWCRRDAFSNPDDPDLKEIEDMRLATSVGRGSVSWYYVVEEIRRQGYPDFNLSDADIQRIPSADTVAALQNNAIQCGILLDPVWTQVKDDPNYFLAATQTPGEPLGIYAYGKRLLEDRRDIGEAFARAYIRTVNTYFNGDYHQDDEVMQEIAEVTGQPVEQLKQFDSLVMDWEFREGTFQRVQEQYIDLGVITDFSEPVPDEKIVDTSFYLKAVGAQ